MSVIEPETATEGQWLSVPLAAIQLGLSESTLRRRIKAGFHQTRQEPFKGIQILTPDANIADGHVPSLDATDTQRQATTVIDGQAVPDIASHAFSEMRALVEQERARSATLEERLRQAEQAATIHQERNRNLEAEVQRLSAQLALPEPTPEPTSPPNPVEALRSQVEQLQARLEAPRTPWWAFWRRR